MKYPDATPVDEPVAKPKQAKAKMYPDSVPVDEPVSKPKQKLSFPDFKDRASEEIGKAKTKIGGSAGEKKYYNTVLDPSTSREDRLEMIKNARDEGDNEVKRETRGAAFAKGGSVSSRADGCAQRGKTKGKMVTMKNGGMC